VLPISKSICSVIPNAELLFLSFLLGPPAPSTQKYKYYYLLTFEGFMTSPITQDAHSYVWASGIYLEYPLPLNFRDWNQKQIEQYCLANAWAKFKFEDGKAVFEVITNLANKDPRLQKNVN